MCSASNNPNHCFPQVPPCTHLGSSGASCTHLGNTYLGSTSEVELWPPHSHYIGLVLHTQLKTRETEDRRRDNGQDAPQLDDA